MQTNFSAAQLADPDIRESEKILRACVHCGFCTATCPTYVLLGDELDSPRGRIYLIKEMLENGRPADARTVRHVDRCLSCLSCMTTCPSSVNYMHLVDHARAHIEQTYKRPWAERQLRALLGAVLPRPGLFKLAMIGAMLARPFRGLLPHGGRLRAMLDLAPTQVDPPGPRAQVFAAQGPRRKRVALLAGCAQQVLAPRINEATIRLLTRHGCDVAIAPDAGCCGSLNHHMGQEETARGFARANIAAWSALFDGQGPDAVVINTSGCGTLVKDYGFLLRNDPQWAASAARIGAMSRDVSELLSELGIAAPARPAGLRVAYQSACSLQHGQKVTREPTALLKAAGFDVRELPESHICCGSAGTYNMMQPAIAGQLRERKLANIARVAPEVIASGNLGCMTHLAVGTDTPIVHTVELLDWATGGPMPAALEKAQP